MLVANAASSGQWLRRNGEVVPADDDPAVRQQTVSEAAADDSGDVGDEDFCLLTTQLLLLCPPRDSRSYKWNKLRSVPNVELELHPAGRNDPVIYRL